MSLKYDKNLSNFSHRLVSSIFLIPIVIFSIFLLSSRMVVQVSAFVSTLAAWEWSQFIGFKKQFKKLIYAFLFGFSLLFLEFFFINLDEFMMNQIMKIILIIGSIWWFFAIILITTFPKSSKIWGNSSVLKSLFYVLTIFPFNFCIIFLKDIHRNDHPTIGSWLILYVILLVWVFDISSYFFGKMLGKKKLAEHVSPNKTIEGVLGGMACSQIFSWTFFYANTSIFLGSKYQIFFSSLIIVIISIFGDLLESMFKRKFGIKDTGRIIPGHGGILDRIDSLTSAIPTFIVFLKLFTYDQFIKV
ncbi:phosphatidate cytidylyltransferase [Candidatus Riesia pediculicola]|uniref:phosphatidate cytidylyltransferase n=1 Tax=Candidatus Riesia pediculicola TaxID=401619 RepID=UPI0009C1CB33|nr:phosphatidate cytidylyltransferase [Candidatus Riesia pediculicola]ARC54278.1 hypothetical protein AOE57_01575 [Candidatus Riesia pediculicola]